MLSSLVSQLLREPEKRKTKRNVQRKLKPVSLTCPRCKKNPRAVNAKNGMLYGYCSECRKELNAHYSGKK